MNTLITGVLCTLIFMSSVSANGYDEIIVTTTREAKNNQELAESVDAFDSSSIQSIAPAHPSELLNRSPGVHVNNLGGEDHMSAIR